MQNQPPPPPSVRTVAIPFADLKVSSGFRYRTVRTCFPSLL
jgi:hypothetical protein